MLMVGELEGGQQTLVQARWKSVESNAHDVLLARGEWIAQPAKWMVFYRLLNKENCMLCGCRILRILRTQPRHFFIVGPSRPP